MKRHLRPQPVLLLERQVRRQLGQGGRSLGEGNQACLEMGGSHARLLSGRPAGTVRGSQQVHLG